VSALPLVGLGSSATFAQVARSEDYSALREVLRTMVERGGTVFDTAPSYGASEQVAGDIAAELGITDRIFWATKVNVAQGPGAAADPARARQQIETSFNRLRKRPIDLIQVHNLADVPTQLGILKELKGEGRIRYIGVTTTAAAVRRAAADHAQPSRSTSSASTTRWTIGTSRSTSCRWRRIAGSA
jgi:aryl-alcohol dehydrogenase-like predicted oxidoreductase